MSPAILALVGAAERLERVNPDALSKVLAAAQAFVSVHDNPGEPERVFAARLESIGPGPAPKAVN